MKSIIHIEIIFLLIFACKSDRGLIFCEGVSTKGEEINCGTKFSTGDLTVIISSKESFGIDEITMDIIKIVPGGEEKMLTLPVEVKADSSKAIATISLYEEGRYRIQAMKGEVEISQGNVEILDTY
ncbi:MAG: hypothetical protein SVZ03_12095 [Spirochaetota bacterium]|nr:hypothetical protein [Spirochaetota bacterium]